MKKRLLTFNGGLSTKLAPHLIEANQATECLNVDLTKGSLYPMKTHTHEVTTTGIYAMMEDGVVIANTDPTDVRSYARFGGRIYWSNKTYGTFGLMRYNGTSAGVEAAAPPAPDGSIAKGTPTANGNLSGDYIYAYTYIDTDGIESAPSGYSAIVTVSEQDVPMTITVATAIPADVVTIRVYRTGGNNPTFNLIAELPKVTLTFTDTTRDIDVSRIELASFENSPPPVDLEHLVENSGTMWGSVGEKIYFSINGSPEYWNSLDYIPLNNPCTGIGTFGNLVIAFTRSGAYAISGYSRDTVTLDKLPYREGCVNHGSIANVGDYLVWVSKNGVCVFDGNVVRVATRNLLSWNDLATVGELTWDDIPSTFDANSGFDVVDGISFQGKYYGVYNSGLGILQVEDAVLASTISIDNPHSIFYDDVNNYLTVVTEDDGVFNTRSIDTNSAQLAEATWKTGQIQDEAYDVLKQYRRIRFDVAPLSVTIYTNDKEFTIKNKKDFFLPSGFTGNHIQMSITTDKEIRSCTYEYGLLYNA